MSGLNITISGADTLGTQLDRLSSGLPSAMTAALEMVGSQIFQISQELVPVKTGNLKSSGHFEVVGDPIAPSLEIGYDAEYASNVEYDDSVHHENGQAHYLGDAIAAVLGGGGGGGGGGGLADAESGAEQLVEELAGAEDEATSVIGEIVAGLLELA